MAVKTVIRSIYLCWFVLHSVLSPSSKLILYLVSLLSLFYLLYSVFNQSIKMRFSLTHSFIHSFIFRPSYLVKLQTPHPFTLLDITKWHASCLLVKRGCFWRSSFFESCVHKIEGCHVHQQLHILCHYRVMHSGSVLWYPKRVFHNIYYYTLNVWSRGKQLVLSVRLSQETSRLEEKQN